MMAMVVPTGLRPAVLMVPVAFVGFGVVDLRDRGGRRVDDRRWS
jgi:hypothetical protein